MSDEYDNTDENHCDWKQGNCGELRCLRAENARLLAANKDLQLHFEVVKEDLKKAEEEITRLRDLLSEGDAVLSWVLLEGIDEAIPTTCPVEYERVVDAAKAIAAAIAKARGETGRNAG